MSEKRIIFNSKNINMTTSILFCSGDSVASHACGNMCTFAKEVREIWDTALQACGTNQADVSIVEGICGHLVGIAFIAAVFLLVWKVLSLIGESQRECRKRQWSLEDKERELRAQLCNKLLDMQKEDTQTCDSEGKEKNLDKAECRRYKLMLCKMIRDMQSKKPGLKEMKEIDANALESLLKEPEQDPVKADESTDASGQAGS